MKVGRNPTDEYGLTSTYTLPDMQQGSIYKN
jgi:hypothetical protein